MDALAILRFAAGSVLLLWLPGYLWSRVLLTSLGRLERFAFSVVLSVATVSLFVYLGNVMFDLRISPESGVLVALVISAAALVPTLARALRTRLDRWTS